MQVNLKQIVKCHVVEMIDGNEVPLTGSTTWASSDGAVAVVNSDDGVHATILPIAVGTCDITVTLAQPDGSTVSASLQTEVIAAPSVTTLGIVVDSTDPAPA